MELSATAAKNIARDLYSIMEGSADKEVTVVYAESLVANKLKGKGLVPSPETVKAVLGTGVRRGWFRVYNSRVVPALAPAAPAVEVKVVVTEPTKLRTIMQMYWDDETLNKRCTLGAGSRPTLDTAINKVNLVAGDYILDGTKTEKQVRRDVENLLERRFPNCERATTSNYAGNVLHHILGLAKADGQISFAS